MTQIALSLGSAGFSKLREVWNAHGVWLVLIALLLGLALVSPSQAVESANFTVVQLLLTAPYLLLAIAAAAYAGATGADGLIARAFTGSPAVMIVFAALAGALSPFCSCGVIPLIAALLAMGVPLSAVMAFWLASPLMDPSMFALTVGSLGLDFAIAKTVAAIAIGLMGGFAVLALRSVGGLSDPLREGVGDGGCGGSKVRSAKDVAWRFWQDEARTQKFTRVSWQQTVFLTKWLALAFFLESIMLAYTPAGWVASVLGGEGIAPIATATFVGVPAYLNGYAALPLVGGLIEQGMQTGAGMAFLIAGGVTSIPAAVAVFALVKKPVFGLYIILSLAGAFATGLIWQGIAG